MRPWQDVPYQKREGRAVTDDGIGRLLVASLHQAIGDVLPTRLDYYEHWLSPMGLREGRSGLAPLGAVLSFLRQEGESPYHTVMTAAGRYSAEWQFADGGAGQRLTRWLPRRLRRRAALRRARGLLQMAYQPLRVTTSVSRSHGTVVVDRSVFCTLREPWPWPTCTYLSGAITRHPELHGLDAYVRIYHCRGQADAACRLSVSFDGVPEGTAP